MAVSRIAVSVHTRKMRRSDRYNAPGSQQAMNFLHDPRNLGDMFEHVLAENALELIVAERVRETV